MTKIYRVSLWVGAIFLAAAFVLAGVLKLVGIPALRWSERFAHWGYPANASYVVGVLEILGGLGVLIPQWRCAASLALGAIMVGAAITHVVNDEFPRVVPPLVLGAVALLICWAHRRASHRRGT